MPNKMDEKQLLSLMKTAAGATPNAPVNYSLAGQTISMSYAAVQQTLRDQLNMLASDKYTYETNKLYIFKLIEQTATEVVPQNLISRYGQFAEVQRFALGDRPIFTRKGMGRMRAKQFVTVVGAAGVYETFKLDNESFEVKTGIHGGAVEISLYDFLTGRLDFGEMLQIIIEGMDERIYREIAVALQRSINQLPAANKISTSGFDQKSFDSLISTARVYGPPTIYTSYEFATKILPDKNWISENMKDQVWAQGHLGNYKSCPVIILPNSFEDESNSTKIIDPGYTWIIPAGAETKPVKVAFEGGLNMRELDNRADWSKHIDVFQQVGVGVMLANNICSYVDTALAGHLENPYKKSTTTPTTPPAGGAGA